MRSLLYTALVVCVFTVAVTAGNGEERPGKRVSEGGSPHARSQNAGHLAKSLLTNGLTNAFNMMKDSRGCSADTVSKLSRAGNYFSNHAKAFACGALGKEKCFGDKSKVDAEGSLSNSDVLLQTSLEAESGNGGAACASSMAYTLSGISAAIYRDDLTVGESVPCPTCRNGAASRHAYTVVQIWNSNGAQGYAAGVLKGALLRNGQNHVLVFRGTDMSTLGRGVSNWGTNLHTTSTQYVTYSGQRTLPGRVHEGFYNAYKALCTSTNNGLCAYLDEHKETLRAGRFYVTGHSLGGAMAQAAAVDIVSIGIPVTRVYTYGQPRFATPRFRQTYNQLIGNRHHIRFIAFFPCTAAAFDSVGTDLVTNVPPAPVFRHVGRECRIACCTNNVSGHRRLNDGLPQCAELSGRCHMMASSYNIMDRCTQEMNTAAVQPRKAVTANIG